MPFDMYITAIKKKHTALFGDGNKIIVRSPGRINLIGEHTDYNDGFVFPAAINKAIWFVASGNNKNLFRFFSFDFNEYFEISVAGLSKSEVAWANYLLGMAAQFVTKGYSLSGVDVVFGGDIPVGAGLSSSAAVETGFAMVLNQLFGFNETKLDMVMMAQKAEHDYAGVMCGIMDQFAVVFGLQNRALKLDCRTLDYEYADINLEGYKIILIDTKVKHALASSAYNQRRVECETGVSILKKENPEIRALRDVSMEMLRKHQHEMSETVYRRCSYVVKENSRVLEAFSALNSGNLKQFGALMFKTHEGLRDDYEVSCNELDTLFNFARTFDGVIGSRMMGGGFGGCTINLVESDKVERFKSEISNYYQKTTGKVPGIYEVEVTDGTRIL